jgi:hypothetical protein
MDSEKLSSWLQVLGMLGIVASLIFVGLQIKQTDAIASLETQENAVARNLVTLEMMADNIDVWQRGCVGEELTPAEQALMAKIYWAYVANNFTGWRRLRLSDYRDVSGRYQIAEFAANIHRYPGFRKIHESKRAWNELLGGGPGGDTVNTYYDLVSKKVDELSRLEPNPQYDAVWCGMSG